MKIGSKDEKEIKQTNEWIATKGEVTFYDQFLT